MATTATSRKGKSGNFEHHAFQDVGEGLGALHGRLDAVEEVLPFDDFEMAA